MQGVIWFVVLGRSVVDESGLSDNPDRSGLKPEYNRMIKEWTALKLVPAARIGTFRSEFEYEIEYEYEFQISNQSNP